MPTTILDERFFAIKTPDHHQLAAVLHIPKKKTKTLIILSHGFTGTKIESGRLFVTTARALAAAGFTALRFDFWGSGDSGGEFYEMSPNTEINDLKNVIRWARQNGWKKIGLLGLSFGGAVTICTASQLPHGTIQAMVTWSSVPSFAFWRHKPELPAANYKQKNPLEVSLDFFKDRPEVDVPEAYKSLYLPKLQIQGDHDIEGFRETFSSFFPDAPAPKKHVVIPGGDHVFTTWKNRKKVIALTAAWFKKYLA
jgi:uncharacterized protein